MTPGTAAPAAVTGAAGATAVTTAPLAFEDYLALDTLYSRFDAIARGRARGDSSAVHRAVLSRLAFNRRQGEALGWTMCALERRGGSGRLQLLGVRADGDVREALPDWIPGSSRPPEPLVGASLDDPLRFRRAQARYAEIKAAVRGRLLAACPGLAAGAYERIVGRMATAALRRDAAIAASWGQPPER